jgi:hypothetical protein
MCPIRLVVAGSRIKQHSQTITPLPVAYYFLTFCATLPRSTSTA